MPTFVPTEGRRLKEAKIWTKKDPGFVSIFPRNQPGVPCFATPSGEIIGKKIVLRPWFCCTHDLDALMKTWSVVKAPHEPMACGRICPRNSIPQYAKCWRVHIDFSIRSTSLNWDELKMSYEFGMFQTLSRTKESSKHFQEKWKIAFIFASCELKFQSPSWCFGEKTSWHLNFAWVPVTQTWVTHDLIPLDCQSNPKYQNLYNSPVFSAGCVATQRLFRGWPGHFGQIPSPTLPAVFFLRLVHPISGYQIPS